MTEGLGKELELHSHWPGLTPLTRDALGGKHSVHSVDKFPKQLRQEKWQIAQETTSGEGKYPVEQTQELAEFAGIDLVACEKQIKQSFSVASTQVLQVSSQGKHTAVLPWA